MECAFCLEKSATHWNRCVILHCVVSVNMCDHSEVLLSDRLIHVSLSDLIKNIFINLTDDTCIGDWLRRHRFYLCMCLKFYLHSRTRCLSCNRPAHLCLSYISPYFFVIVKCWMKCMRQRLIYMYKFWLKIKSVALAQASCSYCVLS